MAKRKPTIAERQARRKKREENKFIRLYARPCYLKTVKEKAEESGVPWGSIVPGRRLRNEMMNKAEVKAWKILDGLPHLALRRRVLERMAREMEGVDLSWR